MALLDGKIPVNQCPEQAASNGRLVASHGRALGTARLRTRHEDFVVEERLPFEATGSGQHWLLYVREDGWNTAAAARWLAERFGCRARDIGFCGHKDRHAVTAQYFSVPAGESPTSPDALEWPEGLTLIRAERHQRKLRRGAHAGNRFRIVLRDVEADRAGVDARFTEIGRRGFPNRFGAQRFGRDGGNVARARDALGDHNYRRSASASRSIEISSLRSMLFNVVLEARVADGTWLSALPADLMLLDGTRSFFVADASDDGLASRLAEGDVHVSGPLWGRGVDGLPPALASREQSILARHVEDCRLLESRGFTMERRALRALARRLTWQWLGADVLEIGFELGRGSYATVLLGECFDLYEPD